jgi:hypothetical protein
LFVDFTDTISLAKANKHNNENCELKKKQTKAKEKPEKCKVGVLNDIYNLDIE